MRKNKIMYVIKSINNFNHLLKSFIYKNMRINTKKLCLFGMVVVWQLFTCSVVNAAKYDSSEDWGADSLFKTFDNDMYRYDFFNSKYQKKTQLKQKIADLFK